MARILILLGLVLLAAGTTRAAEAPRIIDLAIHDGALPKDTGVIKVTEGEDVTLSWTTDAALTIHLHGYDIEQKLSPGAAVPMRFTAKATGRFPIEIHGHGPGGERTLGYLEVHPR